MVETVSQNRHISFLRRKGFFVVMAESEVAQFREQQALEEEAARQGLYGLAMVASHASITARMQIGAERILRLFQEGKTEEAVELMSTVEWC
jgi:hypothetical protein